MKYQKDSEKVANRKYTIDNLEKTTAEINKSAIIDHIAIENHLIDWEEAKILDKDANQVIHERFRSELSTDGGVARS